MIADATILSLTALARIAERHIRDCGPDDVDELLDKLTLAAGMDTERAQAGLRHAVVTGRLLLDRDATIRLVSEPAAA